ALKMVVADLADPLEPKRLPRQVLAAVPARRRARHALTRGVPVVLERRPVLPRMRVERAFAERLGPPRALRASRLREGCTYPGVVKLAVVVVQTEEERAHELPLPAFEPAEASDDAVGRARVLDLHHRALVRQVAEVERLRHHAVETGAFEP